MRRILIATLALAGCATSTINPAPETPTAPSTTALSLHADKAIPADISAAFAREVSARYPGQHGAEAMRAALAAQGFQCADTGASPDVRVGEVYAQCTLPKAHGRCSDKWVVDLRLKQLTRALDFAQVTPEGRFERFCTNDASPNG
jgi:hypothetical protein